MAFKIYIIEDHPLVQRMTYEFLRRAPNLQVCGAAATAQQALVQIPALDVDLALVDVSLPDMDGIHLVSELQLQQPTLFCLMFSAHQEASYVQRALAAGARGYLAKGNPTELVAAIHQVLNGEIYLSYRLHYAPQAYG